LKSKERSLANLTTRWKQTVTWHAPTGVLLAAKPMLPTSYRWYLPPAPASTTTSSLTTSRRKPNHLQNAVRGRSMGRGGSDGVACNQKLRCKRRRAVRPQHSQVLSKKI